MNYQDTILRTFSLGLMLAITPTAFSACLNPTDASRQFRPTLEQELATADAVIIGTVADVHGLNDDKTGAGDWTSFIFTVTVKQTLTGYVREAVELYATNNSDGYKMVVGDTHLLFLSKRGSRFVVNACGNSMVLPKGQPVIESLQSLLRGRATRYEAESINLLSPTVRAVMLCGEYRYEEQLASPSQGGFIRGVYRIVVVAPVGASQRVLYIQRVETPSHANRAALPNDEPYGDWVRMTERIPPFDDPGFGDSGESGPQLGDIRCEVRNSLFVVHVDYAECHDSETLPCSWSRIEVVLPKDGRGPLQLRTAPFTPSSRNAYPCASQAAASNMGHLCRYD